MRTCSLILVVSAGVVGMIGLILLCVFLTQNDNTTTTTTRGSTLSSTSGSTLSSTLSSTITPTVWPTQYAIPLGFSRWRIFLETSTNTSTLNAVGQELTTNTNGHWLWIESPDKSRQFTIALNMTMSSPHLAYYSATELPNPVFISLMPDLIHSNGQCILQVRTYPSGTTDFSNTNPETTLFFIMFIEN